MGMDPGALSVVAESRTMEHHPRRDQKSLPSLPQPVNMDAVKVRQYRKSSIQASKTPVTDPETANDKLDSAYLKRREQVRRAQRTHRERKENYIKALEDEVHQLRSQTLTLGAEISLLRGVIRQLDVGPMRQAQQKHRLEIAHSQPVADTISFATRGSTNPPDIVTPLHRLRDSVSDTSCASISGPETTPAIDDTYTQFCTFPEATPIPNSALALSLASVDQASLGLEFVLTLESPCKEHHVEIAVALSGNPASAFSDPTSQVQLPLSNDENTSNIGLENLLALAGNLSLTSEITPVQAWYEIRSHPGFQLLDAPRLKKLAEDLLIYVRCYGFGAVIETDVFRRLYNELWPREY